jgi:hypothetical protein
VGNPNANYPGIHEDYHEEGTKAIDICRIALEAFFEDTKHLVARGVRGDIQRTKVSARSKRELADVSERALIRETSLVAWLKCPLPLAYGNEERGDVYRLVLLAVSPDEDSVAHGLPNWEHFTLDRATLAESLLKMARQKDPMPPKAPVLRKGSFLPVLKVAISAIFRMFEIFSERHREAAVLQILRKSLKIFDVKMFPAAKPSTNARGAPNSRPVWNSWGNLGLTDKSSDLSERGPSSSRRVIVPPATVAFNNVIASDRNAPWTANHLDLTTLHTVLHLTPLPKDFYEPAPTHNAVVDDTYRWVRENYDGTKPVHHLALLVSIIVASSIRPYLFVPANLKDVFSKARSKDAVREAFENVDWIEKPKKGGMVDRSIFVSMITTFIIALYEKENPLRRSMSSSKRGGLGNDWRDKHGEPFLSTFGPPCRFPLPLPPAVKGITYTTLIRVGMLWGQGSGAYEKGTFGRNWGCHSPKEIQILYDVLREKLDSTPFGAFDSLALLIGDKNARKFCARLKLNIRPAIV